MVYVFKSKKKKSSIWKEWTKSAVDTIVTIGTCWLTSTMQLYRSNRTCRQQKPVSMVFGTTNGRESGAYLILILVLKHFRCHRKNANMFRAMAMWLQICTYGFYYFSTEKLGAITATSANYGRIGMEPGVRFANCTIWKPINYTLRNTRKLKATHEKALFSSVQFPKFFGQTDVVKHGLKISTISNC